MSMWHWTFAVILLLVTNQCSRGAEIFTTSALGKTGVSWQELVQQSVPGTNVNPDVFVGARFLLSTAAQSTRIGGHFVGHPDNTTGQFVGALVKLTSEADFPDSRDFTSPDVLGVATLEFPQLSAEVYGNISVHLEPGWYAVAFGTGVQNTTAVGAAVRNGSDLGSQSYISLQPGANGWRTLDGFFNNHRFVVEGTHAPEPGTTYLAVFACFWLGLVRRRGGRCGPTPRTNSTGVAKSSAGVDWRVVLLMQAL